MTWDCVRLFVLTERDSLILSGPYRPPVVTRKDITMSKSPQQNPVAAAISAISSTQHEMATSCGQRWGKTRQERIAIAADYSRSLGTSPSFDVWEAHRIDWVNGYVAANPNNTGNAADAAWTDFAGVIKALYALTKPKSDNLGADKKREERAKKSDQLLVKYQGKTAADLRGMRAAALQSAAKGSELAEKIAAELKKVLRVKTSAEDAAIGEVRKGLRTQVKTAAGKCTDLDKLRAALEILDNDTDLEFITQVETDEDFAEDRED